MSITRFSGATPTECIDSTRTRGVASRVSNLNAQLFILYAAASFASTEQVDTFPIEPYQVFYYFVRFKLGNGLVYRARCQATVSYDIRFIFEQGN